MSRWPALSTASRRKGDVTREHYDRFASLFVQAFANSHRVGGVPTASRLLAMKRPDVFLCVSDPNLTAAAAEMGFAKSTLKLDNYWGSRHRSDSGVGMVRSRQNRISGMGRSGSAGLPCSTPFYTDPIDSCLIGRRAPRYWNRPRAGNSRCVPGFPKTDVHPCAYWRLVRPLAVGLVSDSTVRSQPFIHLAGIGRSFSPRSIR